MTLCLEHTSKQSWADTGHVAWLCCGHSALNQLALALENPELRPNLLLFVCDGMSDRADASLVSGMVGLSRDEALEPRASTLVVLL
ncbi:MAG: hypothetical protein ACREIC_20830, partial [Limisphaerales bacterium]